MSLKWQGSTTYNGIYNILSLNDICKKTKCFIKYNSENVFFKRYFLKIIIENIEVQETKKSINEVFENNHQIIIFNPKKDIVNNLPSNYKCFFLTKKFKNTLVVFLTDGLKPNYLKDLGSTHLKIIDPYKYHLNKKC